MEWKEAKQIDLRVSVLLVWDTDLIAEHAQLNIGIIRSIWFFQFKWLLVCRPRNFIFIDSSMYFSS
jgi:hypothetical protein